MAIKKQVFVMSVVFDEEETYAESAVDAIEHELFNLDGVIEWDIKLKSEDSLYATITEEDLTEEDGND